MRPCILLIRCHMQIYTGLFTSTLVLGNSFLNQMMSEKILCFEMKNFRALNTLTSYLNISKIRVLIQIIARIQMDLSKNNCFSAEEAKSYIPRAEKEGVSI